MKDDNYIVIQGFMRNQLNLKGNELLVYALIYGFSQDDESEFAGSISYIADWIGSTKQTVYNIINSLLKKELIDKHEEYEDGVKICSYWTLPAVKKFDEGVVKNFEKGSQKILPNNNIDNNIYNYTSVDKIIEQYNYICVSLPKCIKATAKRRSKIVSRLKAYSVEDFVTAFEKAEQSDFMTGRTSKWRANIDWFIDNDDNITKVLEGKYDNGIGKVEDELQRAYNEIRGEQNDNRPFGD